MAEVNGTSQRSTDAGLIPNRCDVAIIGGGPAGSAAATLLAREGFDVVVFEKEKFPRPQVGESILPQIWKFFDLLGVSEKMMRERFLAKSGGIIVWDGKINQIRFTSFGYNDPDRLGLHVERDVFDDILLKHSAESGAQVFEEVMVSRVDFSDSEWPVVYYNDRRGGTFRQGGIACRYVIDASGHASVLARQFGTRKLVSEEVNYLGLWGYYRGVWYLGVDRQAHPPEDCYKVKPVTFINSFEDGWIWHIILRETTSVGLVVNRGQLKGMGKQAQERYLRETCGNLPYLGELLAPGEFIEGSMFFRPDYSFYSEKVTGENFYCIGDAGAFVDPVFSQGVQAALFNGTLATWAISSSFKTPHRRLAYSKIAENMMMQYYGFSRLLALGDFGGEGVDPKLVQAMMRYLPTNELELALAAATTTSR
ncbi:MAG: NAD(P)/FAD-dependent oxidoreductase, partial [Chloroflexota bacterium]